MTDLGPPGQDAPPALGRRVLWSMPGVLVGGIGIAIAVMAIPAAMLLWLLSLGSIPLEATAILFLVVGALTFVAGLVMAILAWRR